MKLNLGRKLFPYTTATLSSVLLETFIVQGRTPSRQWKSCLQTDRIRQLQVNRFHSNVQSMNGRSQLLV